MIRVGLATYNEQTRVLIGPAGLQTLSPQHDTILRRLIRTPGRAVSNDALIMLLYPDDNEPADAMNTVKVRVHELRRALLTVGEPGRIVTVWRTGYCWQP